jgi:hypothetical protein
MPVPTCALCSDEGPLRNSHIVARFVYARLQEDSITGFLRSLDRPAARIQDGFKDDLLCGTCEQKFGRWEERAARTVFASTNQDLNSCAEYDSTFARFAISVWWRVLVWRSDAFLRVSPQLKPALEAIEQTWRHFLVHDLDEPSGAACHAVVLSEKLLLGIGPNALIPTGNFQKYLHLAVDINVISDGRIPIVYAKLGRLLLFGLPSTTSGAAYVDSRIQLDGGSLDPGPYAVPPVVIATLIRNAGEVFAATNELSDPQKKKIEASLARSPRNRHTPSK